jgi:hypothetical protein
MKPAWRKEEEEVGKKITFCTNLDAPDQSPKLFLSLLRTSKTVLNECFHGLPAPWIASEVKNSTNYIAKTFSYYFLEADESDSLACQQNNT